MENKPPAGAYLNAEQLCAALNLQSVETVKTLARKRKISVVRLGYRTHLFDPEQVRRDLEKLTVKALN